MLKKVLARAAFPVSLDVLPLSTPGTTVKRTSNASDKRTVDVYNPNQLTVDFCSNDKASLPLEDDASGYARGKDDTPELPFGFKNVAGSVSLDSERRRLVAGTGKDPNVRDYRLAVTAAVREAQKLGASELVLRSLPTTLQTMGDIFQPPTALSANEVVEKTAAFAVTGAYRYDRLRTTKDKKKGTTGGDGDDESSKLSKLYIDSSDSTAISCGNIIGHCINDARTLGNLREDEGTPQAYCEWIQQHLPRLGVKVKHTLRGEQLQRSGLNLIYNVGKGSKHVPYLVVFEYVGDSKSNHATALVGKGVTFDCGGLNVKPYGSMETMHMDMMGAATVMATMKAAAQLELPINLVAAVGLAENAIGPDSYCPSSIISSHKGLTVEVLNTDAEGRLVLADTLSFLQKDAEVEKDVSTIIDVATLTGAIVVGLGSRRAGLFGNDLLLTQQLMAGGRSSGDELWPMPIGEEHRKAIKGQLADLLNVSTGRQAGSCTAAAFLSNFIEDGVRWAHLDIAGAGVGSDKPKGFQPAGAPGFGVQLLLDYLRQSVVPLAKTKGAEGKKTRGRGAGRRAATTSSSSTDTSEDADEDDAKKDKEVAKRRRGKPAKTDEDSEEEEKPAAKRNAKAAKGRPRGRAAAKK